MCGEHVVVAALIMRGLSRPPAEDYRNRTDELREDASAVSNGLIGEGDEGLRYGRSAWSLHFEWR